MNKFRKVCSASLCAVTLNSLGAGATSAVKFDIKIEDIGEICPHISHDWLIGYLNSLSQEFWKGNAFYWGVYRQEILEDIKKLIIEKGAANIDTWDIVNIVSAYTYMGDKVLVKFRKNNGELQFMKDPCLKVYNKGDYQSISPDRLIEYFESKYNPGIVLDFDKIAAKTISEKEKTGKIVNKNNLTTDDIIIFFHPENIEEYTLKDTTKKDYMKLKEDLESRHKEEIKIEKAQTKVQGYTKGCLIGVIATVAAAFTTSGIFNLLEKSYFSEKAANKFRNTRKNLADTLFWLK
jgi:hypothetical protein